MKKPKKIFCNYDGQHAWATAHYVVRALKNIGIEVTEKMDEPDIELILNIDYCPNLHIKEGIPSFYWETDSWHPRERLAGFDQLTRVFYGGHPGDGIRYPENAIYLPLAAEVSSHFPFDIEPEYDIVMIGRTGGEYTERDRVLNLLREHYNVFVGLTEPGFSYSEAMSKGKLILHRSVSDANIGMRFFEGMAIGCLLANYIEGMNYSATPYMHYVPFKNDAELVANIDYYIAHPEEREKIAKASRELVALKHTYTNRVQEMLSYL